MLRAVPTPRTLLRWIPAVAWMLVISFWSGQSDLPIDRPEFANFFRGAAHPLAHFFAFATLAALLRWAAGAGLRSTVLAIITTSVFGIVDEWHQSFTPGRMPELADWIVDTVAGASAAIVFGHFLDNGRLGRWRVPVVVPRILLAGVVSAAVLAGVSRVAPSPGEVARGTVSAFQAAVPNRAERAVITLAHVSVDKARSLRARIRNALT